MRGSVRGRHPANTVYNTMYINGRIGMTRMLRKQVYIRPEDQRLLTRAAKRLDVPESEVIRRGISVSNGRSADLKLLR